MSTSQTFGGIRRQLRKKIPVDGSTGGTGFTTVPDGYEAADIRVDVDLAKICELFGTQAMGNKSGRANLLKGAVVVRVMRRARVAK